MAIKLSEKQKKLAKEYDPKAVFDEKAMREELSNRYDALSKGGLAMDSKNRWINSNIPSMRNKFEKEQAARRQAFTKMQQLQKRQKSNQTPAFTLGGGRGAKTGTGFGQIGGGELAPPGSGERSGPPTSSGPTTVGQDMGIAQKTPFAFDPSVDLSRIGKIQYGVFRPGEGQIELQKALEQRAVQQQLGQQQAAEQQQAVRTGQASLVDALRQQAMGQAPTAAEAQFRSAADRTIAQQAALAQGAGGGGIAQRQAAIRAGQTMRGLSQDAVAQALQERQQLAQTAGSLGQGLRQQDLAQQQFQIGQEADYLNAIRAMEEANRGALIEGQLAKVGLIRGQQQAAAQRSAAKRSAMGSLLGGVGSIAAAAILSDENKKKNKRRVSVEGDISVGKKGSEANAEKSSFLFGGMSEKEKKAKKKELAVQGARQIGSSLGQLLSDVSVKVSKKDADPRTFLDALKAYTYEYKDEKHGKGRQLGIMAQDLEKAGPVGKQMVIDTPEGKAVDFGKGFGAILASTVDMHDRVKNLEKILKERKENGNPKKKKRA